MELSELVGQLVVPDPWRQGHGFSPDISAANKQLLVAPDDASRERLLRDWLGKYQPCLFGRLAARAGALSFCVLSDADVANGDEFVKTKIQQARRSWSRAAFRGQSSGFVVALIAESVSIAEPDQRLLALAQRLAFLYLREEISLDRPHLEDVCLEVPGEERETWLWRGGVNFFGSAGDQRWWHDHRIPGGIAFSVNSVGHLVKSGKLAADRETVNAMMGIPSDEHSRTRIDALPKALEFAMRTIDLASATISGRATELRPKPEHSPHQCPTALPPNLRDKDHCEYVGWYDTDATLPSDYFSPAVERPEGVTRKVLDFTYLFDESVDDGDFDLMGEGRRIRAGEPQGSHSASVRAHRGVPLRVRVEKVPSLVEALSTVD